MIRTPRLVTAALAAGVLASASHAATYSSVQSGAYNAFATWGTPSNQHPGRGSSNGFAYDASVTVNIGHVVNIPRNGTPNNFPQAEGDTIHVYGTLVGDTDVENVFGSYNGSVGSSTGSDTRINLYAGSTLRYRLSASNSGRLAGGIITVKGNATFDRNDQTIASDGDDATFRSLTFDTAGATLTIDGGTYVGGNFSGTLFNLAIDVDQNATLNFLGSNNFTAKAGFDVAAGASLTLGLGDTNFMVQGTSTFGAGSKIRVGSTFSTRGVYANQGSLQTGTIELLTNGVVRFNNNAGGANSTNLLVTGSSSIGMVNSGSLGDFTFTPGSVLTLLNANQLNLTGSDMSIDLTGEPLTGTTTLISYLGANDLAGAFAGKSVFYDGNPLTEGIFGSLNPGEFAIDYGALTSPGNVVLEWSAIVIPTPAALPAALTAIGVLVARRRRR